jgi:5-methylcytosine-specific restriction endonuclease McrA
MSLIFIITSFLKEFFTSRRTRRKNYYRNVYLKSDEWKRKRYIVLKRDDWKCTYCGLKATQVHHKRYLKNKIGKEPIDWLVSVCHNCHQKLHKGVLGF